MFAKQGFGRRGDVFEPDLTFVPDQVLRKIGDIARGLLGKAGERYAFWLCLNHAAQFAADEKRIVDRSDAV